MTGKRAGTPLSATTARYALHDHVEYLRRTSDAFVVQGSHHDRVVVNVAGLLKGMVQRELAARADAQVKHLYLAIAPVDAHRMVLDRLVRDYTAQSYLLER